MTTTLCLVTDRRRLASQLHQPPEAAIALLRVQIAGAVRGGIDLVQIRERDLEGRALATLVKDAVALAAGSRTRIVVNDRADVARACGADGVHLREVSLPPAGARRLLGRRAIIGRSVHDANDVAAALPLDYLIAGTVFPTASKDFAAPLLGVRGLAGVVAAAGPIPVLAIGGVSVERVEEVVRAGAAGLAAIGAFIPLSGDEDFAAFVEKTARTMRFTFDSAAELS